MLQQIKTYLPYVLVLIIASLWFNSCQQSKIDSERFLNNLKISRDSTKHFQDKTGQLISQNETIQLTAKELKEQADALGIDKQNLKNQVGKLTNLVSYYKGELVAKGKGEVKGIDTLITKVDKKGDTIKTVNQKFSYSNKYLTFNGLYDPVIDSLNFQYGYKVSLQLTMYKVRHGFLGVTKKPEMFADVRLDDPNAKMQNAQSILIIEDKKWYDTDWFWLGVGAVLMKALEILVR